MNLLENLTPETLATRGLHWENPPVGWEALPGGGVRVRVPGKVDYFRDPAGIHIKEDAPYLWLSAAGDFVARGHVRPVWATTWDAGALMAWADSSHWCKLCYERTDLGTTAAVSVVTNGLSDDANGVNLSVPDLWLQLCRVGNVFGMHYALDGESWKMVRVFQLPVPGSIRVGLVAQCPAGPGAEIDFLHFSVEARTVQSLRAGI